MAPLTELSVNRPGKTRQVSLNGLSTSSGKGRPASLALDDQPSSLPATSAIQSMLKNTTELGDIGSYVAKATKLPRRRSTTTGHPQDHQHHRPRAPYLNHTGGNHITQRRYHESPYDTHEHSLRHNPSLRTNGDHSLTSDTQDHRSDSLTQSSSLNSRRPSTRPSLRSVRPHDHAGPHTRSPLVYPSRLKRPGYRPSSPALSDFNRSDSALHTSIHRAYSNRTISPLSTSSQRRAPAAWNHGLNRSDPLLQYRQAVPFSRKHNGNRSPPFLRRGPLRRSPLGSHRSSIISKARVSKESGSTSTGGRALSPIPLFYDYSEAFEQESFHHTAERSSMFLARQIPQSDGSSEGYQTDVTNTSNTFAKYSSSSSGSKAVTPERNMVEAEHPFLPRLIPTGSKQVSPENNKESVDPSFDSTIDQDLPSASSEKQAVAASNSDPDKLSSRQLTELSTSIGKLTDPFTVSSSSHDELQYPTSAYNPTPKVVKTATVSLRLSSSSSGSQYSTSMHSRQGQAPNPMAIQVPSIAYERQPKALSVSFNHLEAAPSEAMDTEPQQRAASLDARLRQEQCQMFGPAPERSMSSRDSRDRFSRIFSISQDSVKGDLFTGALPNRKTPMTIQQYLRDKKSHSPNTNASTTKEFPPLPHDPPPVPHKGKGREFDDTLAILTANEQAHEANKVMGKDHETFAVNALERLAALGGFARPGIPPRFSSISRHSVLDQPGPSLSLQDCTLSPKPSSEQQPRMFPLTKRTSSLFQAMKELPPLPSEPMVPIPPPQTPSSLELPHRFTPLMPEDWLDTAVADIQESPHNKQAAEAEENAQQQTPKRTFKGLNSENALTASPASARPWNLDASYPWAGTPPKLEVSIPQNIGDLAPEVPKLSRFRLNIHRSSVLGNKGKLTKHRPPNVKVLPLAATNTGTTLVQTRFTQSTENVQPATPNITLVPLSPGLKIEAQSFFSDDSSQKRRKGSLRRRFSQIRGMAMRTASTEDVRGVETGRSTSALGRSGASKRSSKQSVANSDDDSRRRSRKWKILDKIKSWLHRHEQNFKVWRSRFDSKKHRSHTLSANL